MEARSAWRRVGSVDGMPAFKVNRRSAWRRTSTSLSRSEKIIIDDQGFVSLTRHMGAINRGIGLVKSMHLTVGTCLATSFTEYMLKQLIQ